MASIAVSKTVGLGSNPRRHANVRYKKISFDFNAGNTTVLKVFGNSDCYEKT